MDNFILQLGAFVLRSGACREVSNFCMPQLQLRDTVDRRIVLLKRSIRVESLQDETTVGRSCYIRHAVARKMRDLVLLQLSQDVVCAGPVANDKAHIRRGYPDDLCPFMNETLQRAEACFVTTSSGSFWHKCDEYLILRRLMAPDMLDLVLRMSKCLD